LFETINAVFEVEPIAKSGFVLPSVGLMESRAHGDVVPRPKFPVEPSKRKFETPELPKRTVVDAWRPPEKSAGDDVAAVMALKLLSHVNGLPVA
jgi:hypothetical protein